MPISKCNIDSVWKNENISKKVIRKTQTGVHEHVFVPITFIQERHIKQNRSKIEDRDHGHYANCPLYHFDVIKCKLF